MRGSIVKKGNKYYIVLDVYDATGKRKRKWYSGFSKKTDAEKALPDLLKKAQAGTLIESKKITLKDFLEDWLENHCKPRLAPTTYELYRIHVEIYIVPVLGKIQLQKLQPIHLNNFFNKLLKDGLSTTTVRSIYRTVSSALNYAFRMRMIDKNPLQFVDPPKKQKSPGKALDPEDIMKIMRAARKTEFEIPVHLAISLGLRRGEILGLRWIDVNLKKGYIQINQTLARTTGKVFTKKPKSEGSQRKVFLPEGLIFLLKSYRKKQKELKIFLGPEYKDNGLVICRKDGRPWNPSTFTKRFQEFIEKNNLPKMRFHDLRHTNSTLLMGYGKLPPKTVAELLGHSTTDMTESYTHINDKMKKEAASIIQELIYADIIQELIYDGKY